MARHTSTRDNNIQLPSIIITIEKCHETDAVEPVMCPPWSTRIPKMAQPNLDYTGKAMEWSPYSNLLIEFKELSLHSSSLFKFYAESGVE